MKWVMCTMPEEQPVVSGIRVSERRAVVSVRNCCGSKLHVFYGQDMCENKCATVDVSAPNAEVCIDGLDYGKTYYFAAACE